MISILVSLLILALVVSVIFWVISLIPIPAPFGNVIRVVIAVIALIWLIEILLPFAAHTPLYR